MPGVFRDVTLEWDGKPYTVTPSNRLLRQIEGAGQLSILAVIAAPQLPVSQAAFIMASLLAAAGCSTADEDEIIRFLVHGGDEAKGLWEQVADAVMPVPAEKKPEARETTE